MGIYNGNLRKMLGLYSRIITGFGHGHRPKGLLFIACGHAKNRLLSCMKDFVTNLSSVTNFYYGFTMFSHVISIDEFQINEINVDLRTSGFDNEVLSVDACAV